jgi:uncharacterized protein DUF5990
MGAEGRLRFAGRTESTFVALVRDVATISCGRAREPLAVERDVHVTLTVEIRGSDLPGRHCGPNPEGRMYENVHVGLARRAETVELVRGDARSARWAFEITVRRDDEGGLDFGGPFVH